MGGVSGGQQAGGVVVAGGKQLFHALHAGAHAADGIARGVALGESIVEGLEGSLFFGEIALDGSVLATRGEVPYQILAREMGLDLVGGEMGDPVSLPNVNRYYVQSISAFRGGKDSWAALRVQPQFRQRTPAVSLDYADVVGQEIAKRGMVIAAAGEHGLMMI